VNDPKEETTYGLSPDRLARLLALGLEDKKDRADREEEQTAAEVLEEMLSNKLPPEEVLGADRTIGSLFLDPKSDLTVIKTLKEYGKELVRRADSEIQKVAATAIYYAAIASALVFHQKKITRHSYAKLQKAYEDLEQKKWIPSDLKRLLKKAKAACQEGKA
jgi:hypothetical protein